MSTLLNAGVAAGAVLATLLAVLGFIAYRRSRSPRLALLALGFAAFASGSLATSWWLFRGQDVENAFGIHVVASAVGLLLVYLAAVKR